ncbi:hypothetical protein RND71_006594 [Anisodus tanguticus]|uniref:Uncharacterized protein n=1 Tax=Anisodus tanguticus TaxID=243964 RepID=A0AAE1SVC5_9SOLA|nr:hypothetical protein RND71_006594 [Anisodus tanguticus]
MPKKSKLEVNDIFGPEDMQLFWGSAEKSRYNLLEVAELKQRLAAVEGSLRKIQDTLNKVLIELLKESTKKEKKHILIAAYAMKDALQEKENLDPEGAYGMKTIDGRKIEDFKR